MPGLIALCGPPLGAIRVMSALDQARRAVAAASYPEGVQLEFSGQIWFWRGPSPWHFVTVPDDECAALEAASALVSYGWGMIPVTARIGDTEWTTSLFPKDGQYVVPLKSLVRKTERLELRTTVTVRLTVNA